MSSIANEGASQIPGLLKKFENMGAPMGSISKELRAHLLDTNQIVQIPDASDLIQEVSLATIDGGSVLDQLSFADLIVTGATLGEGYNSKQLYESDAHYPVLSYVTIVQHQWKNSSVLSPGLMASQELSLIGKVDHNVRIIDGSWTSGLTSLILASLHNENASVSILDSALTQRAREGWDGKDVLRAVDRLTSPWRYRNTQSDLIALSKSDSSMVWSRKIQKTLGKESDLFKNIELSDRNLASLVLHPGEMLAPTYVDAGKSLAAQIEKSNPNWSKLAAAARWLKKNLTENEQVRYNVEKVSQLSTEEKNARASFLETFVSQLLETGYEDDSLPAEERNLQERLNEISASSGGAWVWATYFLPSDFEENSKILRMEFTRDWSEWDETNTNMFSDLEAVEDALMDGDKYYDPHISADPHIGYRDLVLPKGQRLVSLVNQDIVSPEILEPWSQYIADRNAKQVSALAKAVRTELISSVQDVRLRAGLLQNYRT